MMLACPKVAAGLLMASFAAIASPAHAEDRSQLNACQALVARTAQSANAVAASTKPGDAELQRCRQIIREWTSRDQRMSVDEQGGPLR